MTHLTKCGCCGKSYTLEQLDRLEFIGLQKLLPGEADLLMWNCPAPCSSTFSVTNNEYTAAIRSWALDGHISQSPVRADAIGRTPAHGAAAVETHFAYAGMRR